MGGRVTGTEAETAVGDWVQATLEELGYTVTVESFDYDVDGGKGSSENIIAVDVETPQTIQFIFFGAEEAGLCGSDYHVSQITQGDKDNVLLMINYDSLVAGDNAYVYGDGE
ncbi:MAG TPA: M28 family peptidase [Anaerovoracaceae bacterium]|nr:M28 family peptidase [Anaerovoracaceae bacterium]